MLKEKVCFDFNDFDLDERIDLGQLSEKVEEVFEGIPVPGCCTHVALTPDEFAGATIKDILSEVSEQPRNCSEFGRWVTAVTILIAYVNTKLCESSV
jgi:hypothetical protein